MKNLKNLIFLTKRINTRNKIIIFILFGLAIFIISPLIRYYFKGIETKYFYSTLFEPMNDNNKLSFNIMLFLTPDEANKNVGMYGLPLHHAVMKNDEYYVRLLVKKTKNINYRNSVGWTSLEYAILPGLGYKKDINLKIGEYLVKNGADVNLINHNYMPNQAPLHYAVLSKEIKVIKFLLLNSANPNREILKS